MTIMIRTEIAAALNSHRLASNAGWRGESGAISYTCACGHIFETTPGSAHYVQPTVLLAEHQADVIEQLGYSRRADALDDLAVEEVLGILERRRARVICDLANAKRSHSAAEQQRLNGAEAELSVLLDAIYQIVDIRVVHGQIELPIDAEVAVA